ncbi:MAG: aldo/keto reductase [Patescibacteria group bacterium]
MNYRPLGRTGITVSEVGFGTWGIGGETPGATSYGPTDDTESKRALETAFENGITFYDTSDLYGAGHAEELLGEVFSNRREKIVIASKVGYVQHGGPHDFRPMWIRARVEASLRRLKTDYLDVYQLHSPPMDQLRATPGAIEEMHALKREGKIRAIGISVKSPKDIQAAIEEFGAETIQVNFNLIDQRALDDGWFAFAGNRGVGIIARTPLGFGFLSGAITDLHFPPSDHRSNWPEGQLRRWAEAPKLFAFLGEGREASPTQIALKFCTSFSEVGVVIPGILHPSEAVENAAASEIQSFTAEEIARAREVYKDNEFFDKSLKSK